MFSWRRSARSAFVLLGKGSRFARRGYDLWSRRRDPRLGDIEAAMIHHLYAERAKELGLNCCQLGRVLHITGGCKQFRVCGTSTDFDTMPAGDLAGDKAATRDLLENANLPIPRGRCFPASAVGDALSYARSLTTECVVKPCRDTSSGNGVRVNLTGAREIKKAFRYASLFCSDVLVEQHVHGDNYRFLVYKGRCLSALRRELPHVVGNGVDSVKGLVSGVNATRLHRQEWTPGDPVLLPLPEDTAAEGTLLEQGLTWNSVPRAGQKIVLCRKANYAYGATYTEVLQLASPKAVRASELAADALGLSLAGVDIIAPDISQPEFWINEVNTTPGLEPHYFVSNVRDAQDPIRTILNDVFDLATRGRGDMPARVGGALNDRPHLGDK